MLWYACISSRLCRRKGRCKRESEVSIGFWDVRTIVYLREESASEPHHCLNYQREWEKTLKRWRPLAMHSASFSLIFCITNFTMACVNLLNYPCLKSHAVASPSRTTVAFPVRCLYACLFIYFFGCVRSGREMLRKGPSLFFSLLKRSKF